MILENDYLCKRDRIYGRENYKKELATTPNGFMQTNDSEYVRHVSPISELWDKAK